MDKNTYDAIVIGGGLGGLAAGAWLARAGCKVLLLEKETQVGGYLGAVWHGGYPFSNGPRLLMGCNPDGPSGPGVLYSFLEQLGVQRQCEFIPVQPFVSIRLPGTSIDLHSGRREFIESLRSTGAGPFAGLPDLMALCGRIQQASMRFYTAANPWELLPVGAGLAEVLRYQGAAWGEVLQQYLPDWGERRLVGALWPYLGLPPARASFLMWAVLIASYVDEGAFFCRGGLHRLSEAVAGAFRRDGGEIRLGTAARQLLVRGGRVQGVALENGEQYFARAVIAAIDPRQVWGELLAPELRPSAYLRRLGQLELSIRALGLSLITDLDLPALGFGYDTIMMRDQDAERSWQSLEHGDLTSVFSLTRLDAADPTLAPAGLHLVNLFASLPTAFQASRAALQSATDDLLSAAEGCAPGLSAHMLPVSTGAASGSAAYLPTLFEPIYGWSASPPNSGLLRLAPDTPVRGLLLAGQWVRPGQGVIGVIFSGLAAAKQVLKQRR